MGSLSPRELTFIETREMRFVGALASATIIFDGINASFASITKGLTELQKLIGEDDRSIMDISFQNLNNYGCWCYFDDDVGNGKGLPRDEIDEFCRNFRLHSLAGADYYSRSFSESIGWYIASLSSSN